MRASDQCGHDVAADVYDSDAPAQQIPERTMLSAEPVTPVDWALAARVAARCVRPGPTGQHQELVALVEELRESAIIAAGHVSTLTGLAPARPHIRIIDRPSWTRANIDIIELMAADAITAQTEVGARLAAVELGAGTALLSGKVLGQFDPFGKLTADHGGQLLLVAPNILMVERELDVDPAAFRLWVCLHEQTHATQFAAAPWLANHLRDRLHRILNDLGVAENFDNDEHGKRSLSEMFSAAVRFFHDDSASTTEAEPSLIESVLTESHREVFDEITAVMSLLEGHADVVMDEVGPGVVPGVRAIRQRFNTRRAGGSRLDRMVRKFMGLDAKLAQYRDGAAFVRALMCAGGMETVNRVWRSPKTLPTAEEIAHPKIWLERVAE